MSDIRSLRERAKELRCLYRVHEAVADTSLSPPSVFLRVLEAIPDGWRFPSRTGARIEYLGRSYVGPGFSSEGSRMQAPLRLGGAQVGNIDVVVAPPEPDAAPDATPDGDPFLPEEQELLEAVASRLESYLEWKHTQMLVDRIPSATEHWRWREQYAIALSDRLDRTRFGVARLLLGGSTENGQAGPGSDIDLFVDFRGTAEQRRELLVWIEGWSECLAEFAYRHTGYRIPGGVIDLHWIDASKGPRHLQGLRELAPGSP